MIKKIMIRLIFLVSPENYLRDKHTDTGWISGMTFNYVVVGALSPSMCANKFGKAGVPMMSFDVIVTEGDSTTFGPCIACRKKIKIKI